MAKKNSPMKKLLTKTLQRKVKKPFQVLQMNVKNLKKLLRLLMNISLNAHQRNLS